MILLHEILNKRNLSIEDLKTLLTENGTPLSRLTLTRIRDNSSSPKVSTLKDIARALEIKVCDLIDEEDNNGPSPQNILDEIIKKATYLKSKI